MRKRNIQLKIWVSAKEQQDIRKHVKKAGYSTGTYIRTLLDGYTPKEQPPPDYYSMMRELHAIGNRMNQIAARANATGFFLAKDYAENVKELNKAILKIQASVTLPERRSE